MNVLASDELWTNAIDTIGWIALFILIGFIFWVKNR